MFGGDEEINTSARACCIFNIWVNRGARVLSLSQRTTAVRANAVSQEASGGNEERILKEHVNYSLEALPSGGHTPYSRAAPTAGGQRRNPRYLLCRVHTRARRARRCENPTS